VILAGITLDATNLGIIGTTIAAVGGAYAHKVSRDRRLDEREDKISERLEREVDYWKTEAELWRRRHGELLEQFDRLNGGGGRWPELD